MPYTITNRGTPRKHEQVDQFRRADVGVITDQPRIRTLDDGAENWLETLQNVDPTNGRVLRILKPGGEIGLTYDINGLNITGDVIVDGAVLANGGPFFYTFNADDTGGSAVDTDWADLMAAIPDGARVVIPPGTYLVNNPLVVSKPCIIEGASKLSTIFTSSVADADVFTVNTSAGTNEFRDLRVTKSVTATGGAGINLAPSTGQQTSPRVINCQVDSQWIGIDVTCAVDLGIAFTGVFECYHSNIRIDNVLNPDSGDGWITNCLLTNVATISGSDYLIRHVGSGGLKITANKLLGGTIQYGCALPLGAQTGALFITGNSFEGQGALTMGGILFDGSLLPTTYTYITISGNEIAGQAIPISSTAAGGAGWISNVAINGNFLACRDGGKVFSLGTGSVWHISGNVIAGLGASATAFELSAAPTRIEVGRNTYSNITTLFNPNAPTFVSPLVQSGNAGGTTNTAHDGGFKTPNITVTFPITYRSAPEVSITPIGATARSAVIVSKSVTTLVFYVIGSANATALTADWHASGLD